MALNVCIMQGNLTAEPEVKYLQDNKIVANFTIGHNKGGNAEAQFFACVAWGKTAEFVQQHFHKGNPIIVQGEIEIQKYQDRTSGETKYATKINVQSVNFYGAPNPNGGQAPAPQQQQQGRQPQYQQPPQQQMQPQYQQPAPQYQQSQQPMQQPMPQYQQQAPQYQQPIPQPQYQQPVPMQQAIPQQNLFAGDPQLGAGKPATAIDADLPF